MFILRYGPYTPFTPIKLVLLKLVLIKQVLIKHVLWKCRSHWKLFDVYTIITLNTRVIIKIWVFEFFSKLSFPKKRSSMKYGSELYHDKGIHIVLPKKHLCVISIELEWKRQQTYHIFLADIFLVYSLAQKSN